MTIDVFWHDSTQTVLVMHLPKTWTTQDFAAARETIIDMARAVVHPIYVILDGTETQLPPNFIPYASQLIRQGPRPMTNVSLYVFVTPNRTIKAMYNAFMRVQGAGLFTNRLVMASTWEAARAMIPEQREPHST